MKKSATSTHADIGRRLDAVLAAKFADISRSGIKRLIEAGAVKAGGIIVKEAKMKIKAPGSLEIEIPEKKEPDPEGETIPLDIIFEDESIIIINKAPGMAVHPGAGTPDGTIVNALISRYANFADAFKDKSRPGIVHRLDKDTSGCLVVAKNEEAMGKLLAAFSSRNVKKTYLAISYGIPARKEGVIDTFFGRHPAVRNKMSVLEFSRRRAVTEYRVAKEFQIAGQACALLEINLKTGRTHQIRVHMAYLRCPVLGDKTYGGRQKISVPRQMLHAWKISFPHPRNGEMISFECPVPDDMRIENHRTSAP